MDNTTAERDDSGTAAGRRAGRQPGDEKALTGRHGAATVHRRPAVERDRF
ncbi:hypothetical protein [Streptomyces sp. NPDC005953]